MPLLRRGRGENASVRASSRVSAPEHRQRSALESSRTLAAANSGGIRARTDLASPAVDFTEDGLRSRI